MTDSRIPDGIGPMRRRILEVALAEADLGVVEQPRGSNRGPRVDVYVPEWARRGRRGPPWCAWFASWVLVEALGRMPTGQKRGGCATLIRDARREGLWLPKSDRSAADPRPIPGDLFLMDTDGSRGSAGHVGVVLRLSEDLGTIATVEGNSGHRVRIGIRAVSDPRIVGFIDTVSDEPNADFALGLVDGEDLGATGTR